MKGHFGYSLIRAIIVISFFAAIHNYCRWYEIAWYQQFSQLVGSPVKLIWISGIVLVFWLQFYMAHRELDQLKTARHDL